MEFSPTPYNSSMRIDEPVMDILDQERPTLSLEFFPPKNELMARDLLENAEIIASHLRPDFVSITYSAATGDLTYLYTQLLRERFGWTVMPHLTSLGHTRDELLAIAENYFRLGIRSLMALRGDIPADGPTIPAEVPHASELVRLLKGRLAGLCLGVAGYPEKHPEAPNEETDLQNLRVKVDQGASFITTQLFFEASIYERFVNNCRAKGITAPILPGLLPVQSLEQAQKFCARCHATLPKELIRRLEKAAPDDQWKVGMEWTLELSTQLITQGAPGVHFYILNRSQSLLELVRGLNDRGMFKGCH